VPSAEQEEARRRGARWDGEHETWYLPEGVDRSGFDQWLPAPPGPNRRTPEWFVAARRSMAEILKALS
jgi:hypothetical protein